MVDEERSGSEPVEYPQQELLPQDVRQGRNRTPLIIAVVAVLVLAAAAGGAYLLLRDDGESTRAAYCDSLTELTQGGDLSAAAEAMGPEITDQLQQVIDEAPDVVADDWNKLRDLGSSAASQGDLDASAAIDALESVQAIAADARDKCDLPIELPDLGGVG